jgi:hypothetical protein
MPSAAPSAAQVPTQLGALVPEEAPPSRARVTPRSSGLAPRVLRGEDDETRLPAPESTQILGPAPELPGPPPSGEGRRRVLVRFRKRGES